MDEPGQTFGELLRRLRLARGLSLRAFQPVANYSKSLIGDWETGRKVPNLDIAERLDHLLDAGGRLIAAAETTRPRSLPERIASEVVKHYAHQGPVGEEIRRRAAGAAGLDVLAVRGLGILGLNDSLLRPALAAQAVVLKARILLLDPDCDAAAHRAAEIGETPAAFAAGIKLTLAPLEELAASAANLELFVGLYESLPIWRIIRVDEVMWVSSFTAGLEGHEATIYEIPRTARGSLPMDKPRTQHDSTSPDRCHTIRCEGDGHRIRMTMQAPAALPDRRGTDANAHEDHQASTPAPGRGRRGMA